MYDMPSQATVHEQQESEYTNFPLPIQQDPRFGRWRREGRFAIWSKVVVYTFVPMCM